jgi:hypothetical protein
VFVKGFSEFEEIEKSSSGVFSHQEITFGHKNVLIPVAFAVSGLLGILGSIIQLMALYKAFNFAAKAYSKWV